MKRVSIAIWAYVLAIILLTSCEKIYVGDMTFLGDSLIAKWDVAETFPGWITENLGRSGCSVSYLDNFAGKMYGKDITVLVGTNDMASMTESNGDRYKLEYINTLLALKASHIYLFSVLPRQTDTSDPTINVRIKDFNIAIRDIVKQYPSITYIDAYDDFLEDSHVNSTLYEPDGLHISNAGYAILKEKLFSAIQQ